MLLVLALHTRLYARPRWDDARVTLAEETGATLTLAGATLPVTFIQGNSTRETLAFAGQPLSEVASQAGQYIKYKCGKGECGTCAVLVDGQWLKSCVAKVQQPMTITVKASMVAPSKKSSKFFSVKSFVSGFWNNLLGMVGFVRSGARSSNAFKERMAREADIAQRAAMKRAARLSSQV